ncbi:conserved hypothetical protein, partial [Ixodes scapularis]
PVASQTKPPTPKHTAVIVKPTPPWSSGGAGDVDGGDTADVAPAPSPKDVFSSALRRDAEDGCPRFPAPTAGVPCHVADDIRSADASHSPERVPWEEPLPALPTPPSASDTAAGPGVPADPAPSPSAAHLQPSRRHRPAATPA